MPKRPFLVLANHDCIPLEGPYRIESIEGQWYVLGHHNAFACDSERAAVVAHARLLHEHDIHALALEALEGLPPEYQVAVHPR